MRITEKFCHNREPCHSRQSWVNGVLRQLGELMMTSFFCAFLLGPGTDVGYSWHNPQYSGKVFSHQLRAINGVYVMIPEDFMLQWLCKLVKHCI